MASFSWNWRDIYFFISAGYWLKNSSQSLTFSRKCFRKLENRLCPLMILKKSLSLQFDNEESPFPHFRIVNFLHLIPIFIYFTLIFKNWLEFIEANQNQSIPSVLGSDWVSASSKDNSRGSTFRQRACIRWRHIPCVHLEANVSTAF